MPRGILLGSMVTGVLGAGVAAWALASGIGNILVRTTAATYVVLPVGALVLRPRQRTRDAFARG